MAPKIHTPPDALVLLPVDWQLFGTLTFHEKRTPPKRVQLCMWFAYWRKLCKTWRVECGRSLWLLRLEKGEITQRAHFHFLAGGLPSKLINDRSCMVAMRLWAKQGGGIARVRIFDRAQDGAAYVLKGLNGADVYESIKFNREEIGPDGTSGRELMLSRGLQGVLAARLERSARLRRAGVRSSCLMPSSEAASGPSCPSEKTGGEGSPSLRHESLSEQQDKDTALAV